MSKEQLKAIDEAKLSKRNAWIAYRALLQPDWQQPSSDDGIEMELNLRQDISRPHLRAVLCGKQPSGSQRQRRNNAWHMKADGTRLGSRESVVSNARAAMCRSSTWTWPVALMTQSAKPSRH